MKKSFKQILYANLKDKDKWNYYCDQDISNFNPFNSEDDSKRFIKKFISLSEKAETNELFKKIEGLNGRAMHVVSTFFLGIYLYENSIISIKKEVDNEILNLIGKYKIESDIKFSFIWFIAYLFHDLGYEFEDDEPIKYHSFNEFFEDKKLVGLKEANGVPIFYKSVHQNYFDFRVKSEKNDHGICAAYILFKDLCSIRREQENSDHKNPNLCWEKSLENVYNFASWIILAHNIWYANEKDKCTIDAYKEAKLDDLILKENEYRITLKNHPFLFLFCLVDSVEPLKRVKDLSLLEKIEIEIKSDKIIIESKLECGCHETILNQAYDLNKWLTTTTKKQNTVEIDLISKLHQNVGSL